MEKACEFRSCFKDDLDNATEEYVESHKCTELNEEQSEAFKAGAMWMIKRYMYLLESNQNIDRSEKAGPWANRH